MVGLVAIILGILVIVFPLFSLLTASIIAGLGIVFLGIWILATSLDLADKDFLRSFILLLIGISGVMLGIGIIGRIAAFELLISLSMYIAGVYLIISGILSIFDHRYTKARGLGGLGIILGFLVMILSFLTWNLYHLAVLIGLGLILYGLAQFITGDDQEE